MFWAFVFLGRDFSFCWLAHVMMLSLFFQRKQAHSLDLAGMSIYNLQLAIVNEEWKRPLQDGPLLVLNGVITPINGLYK